MLSLSQRLACHSLPRLVSNLLRFKSETTSIQYKMIRIVFTAWLLFVRYGLASETLISPERSMTGGIETCSAETRTSILPQVTVEIGSEHLNISGIIRFDTVVTVASCLTTLGAWSKSSILPYEPSSRSVTWANQTTFNRSDILSTKVTITPEFTQTTSSLTSDSSSLVFDHGPTTTFPLTAPPNATMFTGFGYHAVFADPLVWILFGIVHIGMA